MIEDEGLMKMLWMALSRRTSSGAFIPEIDGLRFVAISSVVVYHLTHFLVVKTGREAEIDTITSLLLKGNFGVQLFFVISGFVISLPFARAYLAGEEAMSVGRYFGRRVVRLEPPYILNLIIIFFLLVLFKDWTAADLSPHLLTSMAYVHTFAFDRMSDVNFVAWSLEVEFQFYVVAPILMLVFRVRSSILRRLLIVLAGIGFVVVQQSISGTSPRWQLSILSYGQYFMTGFLLAELYIVRWAERPVHSRWWDLAGVLSWVAIAWLLFQGRSLQSLLPLAVLGAYCAAFRGPWFNRLFRRRGIWVVGGMCYTIYLYHFYVISAVGNPLLALVTSSSLPLFINVFLLALPTLPVVLVVCAVFFVFTEKPFMGRKWSPPLSDLRLSVRAAQ